MGIKNHLRAAALGLTAISVAACAPGGGGPSASAPQTVAQRSASDQRVGDQNHPKIVAQFGGEVRDGKLKSYVRNLGNRLAAKSEQPNAKWTFTVLDSPVVNAFALPGGYVYVTRGLMALANDEAELAGVIGHEIGHVTAAHGSERQQRAGIAQIGVLAATLGGALLGLPSQSVQAIGQIGNTLGQGYVASYSRTQEFEADRLGVRYLQRAGYDPEAQADFLANLQDETQLQARIAGGQYNPNRVDFFASHPATAQRVREAARLAGATGVDGPRNQERFFDVIEGMIYGDSPEQGFVRGNDFIHPVERFRFSMPDGFRIQNSSSAVVAVGPSNSRVIFDGQRYQGGSMDAYIARTWAPGIAQNARTGELQNLRRRTIGGKPAASGVLPVQTQSGVAVLRMTAIRDGDRIYRFLGVQPQGQNRLGERMERAAGTFRGLSSSEARKFKPYKIDIRTVRRGDTQEKIAARMPVDDFAVERFRVLNGLRAGETLQAGQKVKVIVR